MGGDTYDQHYAQLVYDLERVSIDEADLNRRLALLAENPQIDDAILFGAPPPAVRIPPMPSVPLASPIMFYKTCSICAGVTDNEWVQLPNCTGQEHVFCIPCAERLVLRRNSIRTINCSVCNASRRLFKDGINEVLKSSRNENQGRVSFENGTCPYHKDLLLYFCIDCLEPICVQCQNGYHNDHSYETLDTTFNDAKKEIGELESEIKDKRKRAADNIESALNAQGKVYNDAQARRDTLRLEIEAMKAELDRKEREFSATIDTMETSRLQKIEDKLVKLTTTVDSCDEALGLIEQAKSTLRTANPMDFVQFVTDKKVKITEVIEMDDANNVSSIHSLNRAFPVVPTQYAKQTIQRMQYHDY